MFCKIALYIHAKFPFSELELFCVENILKVVRKHGQNTPNTVWVAKLVANNWGKLTLRPLIIGSLIKNVWEETVGSTDTNVVPAIMANDEDAEYEKTFGMPAAR